MIIEPDYLAVLFLAGLVAGFVDSIAGGGGLITIPLLLTSGVTPAEALGTNKLQACFGSGSAAWHYTAAGTVDLRDCGRGFVMCLIGAAAGSILVQQVNPALLRRVIPVLLIVVAVYMLLKPQVGERNLHPRMRRDVFDLVFGLLLGFYDGFFGPGTGTFWTLAFVVGLGFNLTRATGYTKVMNFASNLASLAVFLLSGKVLFLAGLVMGTGQLIGAQLGARMVIRKGTRFIRPVFVTVVLAITFKLLYDSYRGGP